MWTKLLVSYSGGLDSGVNLMNASLLWGLAFFSTFLVLMNCFDFVVVDFIISVILLLNKIATCLSLEELLHDTIEFLDFLCSSDFISRCHVPLEVT
jgi:hypothetical protein